MLTFFIGIPEANYGIDKPVFFGGGLRDSICIPALQRAGMYSFDLTWQDYNVGHWAMLEAHEEVNADLLDWIRGV